MYGRDDSYSFFSYPDVPGRATALLGSSGVACDAVTSQLRLQVVVVVVAPSRESIVFPFRVNSRKMSFVELVSETFHFARIHAKETDA